MTLRATLPADPIPAGLDLRLERVLSEREAAELLGLSRSSLKRLRLASLAPRHCRLSERRIGYAIKHLIAWRESRTA
jgi:predicted DNA-binding transcriptional regulator AlpA